MKQRDKTNLRKCFIVACTIQDLVKGVCGEKRVKKKKNISAIFSSNLLDFLPNDKRVFFPYFLSCISLVIKATVVNI